MLPVKRASSDAQNTCWTVTIVYLFWALIFFLQFSDLVSHTYVWMHVTHTEAVQDFRRFVVCHILNDIITFKLVACFGKCGVFGVIGAVTHSRDNHHLDNDVLGIITERIGHEGFRPTASYEVLIQ